MSSIRKYIVSDANVICDVCGRKRKWHEVTMAYGSGDIAVIVSCTDGCADYRHPLNSPPPIIFDGQPILNARPDVTENDLETFIAQANPSFMTWGKLYNAGIWSAFNFPNTDTNLNGMWTWGNFKRA